MQLTGPAQVLDDPAEVAAVLRTQLGQLEPDSDRVDPVEHGARLGQIRGLRLEPTEVRAKFKYGGNVDDAHRRAVAEHLADRDGRATGPPGHLLRRLERPATDRLDAGPTVTQLTWVATGQLGLSSCGTSQSST